MNRGPEDNCSDSEGIPRSPGFASLEELNELLGEIGRQFVDTAVALAAAPAQELTFGGLPRPNFAAANVVNDEELDPMSMSPSTDFDDDEGEELENLSSTGNTPVREKRFRTPEQSPVKSPVKNKRLNVRPD